MAQVMIDIRHLDKVSWQAKNECGFKPGECVDVWRVNIAANQDHLDQARLILQQDELIRANRYQQEKDRVRFIVSRVALRNLMSRYTNQPAASVTFNIGSNKKPYVDGSDLKYNVSHSDTWVLIAIANSDVGVDTETISASFPFQSILADNFSNAEIEFTGRSAENFYLLWTRKEALTKATAQGLDENLKFIPSLDGSHVTDSHIIKTEKNRLINSFKIDCENWGTVVSKDNTSTLRFFDYL
jgi:4'-phosphopantetheinyl transferase